jgi:hypothetical protein
VGFIELLQYIIVGVSKCNQIYMIIIMQATAGLRLLNVDASEKILQAVT